MMVPLVSVCMQTWNSERFIAEAIESVLGQDFQDLELIIVDGASSDATRQIIERYAKQDPRIRVILHERNFGISKAANDGIEAANGKFVAQIDSDDVWVPDKLTKQLAVLERDEDLVVWSEGEIIDDTGRPTGQTFSERLANNVYVSAKAKKSGNLWQELLPSNYIFHSTIIYKKQNLGDVRYDEGIIVINDFKFFLDLARHYQFYYIAEPLAKYRLHADNTLAGSGPEARIRQRITDKEYISIVEDAMRQHNNEITPTTRAVVYGHIGFLYYLAGETKKGLRFFLRGFICNPFEKRNLWYLQLAFKRMLRAVNLHA
jgi:glycosyltransferase involved in cell wall biosynthesis